MNDKFKFVMPAILEKGDDDGSWKVAGLASTGSMDQQGETIMQKGIDLSPIDQKRGILNWDHKKGPENTIGVLDGYKQGESGLFIKGRLFKNHTKAKAVKEIMDSLGDGDTGRMGLSVEGQILERDPSNPQIIKKCRINAVALTMNPVNADTFADVVKSMNAAEDLEINSVEENYTVEKSDDAAMFTADQVMQMIKKALGVGEGYSQAPNKLTDGDAMATSDMKPQGDKKKDNKKVKKEIQKGGLGSGRRGGGAAPSGDIGGKRKRSNAEALRQLELDNKRREKEGKTAMDDLKDSKKKIIKSMSMELYKSNLLGMLDKLQTLYPESSRSQLWSAIKDRMETTFPEVIDLE